MDSKVPFVKFNNGKQFPIIGLGTCPTDIHRPPSKRGEVAAAVKWALDAGYRHFDCAHIYQNEKEIGEAIGDKLKEGGIKREDLYITSKLWSTCNRPDLVKPALRQTLSDLGVAYLDLYLIHWPHAFKEEAGLFPQDKDGKTVYSDVDYVDTWKALEECVKEGLTRSIGLSNFNSQQIDRILSVAEIKPVVNQVECHPYLNQKKLKEFCESKGILLTAYSPLGSPDRPWAKPGDPQLMDDPKLKALAEKYQKTIAQILIRYQTQRGIIVIPKSVTKSRIESNFDVFDFELSEEDMSYIDSFNCNGRILRLDWLKDHRHFPFNMEF